MNETPSLGILIANRPLWRSSSHLYFLFNILTNGNYRSIYKSQHVCLSLQQSRYSSPVFTRGQLCFGLAARTPSIGSAVRYPRTSSPNPPQYTESTTTKEEQKKWKRHNLVPGKIATRLIATTPLIASQSIRQASGFQHRNRSWDFRFWCGVNFLK